MRKPAGTEAQINAEIQLPASWHLVTVAVIYALLLAGWVLLKLLT